MPEIQGKPDKLKKQIYFQGITIVTNNSVVLGDDFNLLKDAPENIGKFAQTGDSQSPAGWIALILLSGAGVSGALVYRKKVGRSD